MNLLKILKNRKNILGQNARNLNFIGANSNKESKKIADNKLLTKEVLSEINLPVPKLIGTIKNIKEFQEFDWDSLPKSFVMKPVHGVQGGGIQILYNRNDEGDWIQADGSKMSLKDLKRHALDIMEGRFSIKNSNDQIFFEERVRIHDSLKNYSYRGAPDIRVIVYNKIPIMAYIRFPTKESKGKANMILGAVGTGIDMVNGITTTSTYGKANGGKGEPIEFVPGTKLRYQGLKIPYWEKILKSAVKAIEKTGLKFGAVDFLIDQDLGPLIVEINARPGLSIQLANRAGLAWRLEKANGIKVKSSDRGIRIGKNLFGGEIEDEIERISGKELISNRMPVKLYFGKNTLKSMALIDTSRRSTIISQKMAIDLGILDEEILEDEYEIANIRIKLGTQSLESTCRIVPRTIQGYNVIIGRKELNNFIIDIKKVDKSDEFDLRKNVIESKPKNTFKEIDSIFDDISRQVKIIPALRPINLETEKTKFFEQNFNYNPQFEYKPIRFNPDKLIQTLDSINPKDTPMGELYKAKIAEFRKMIYLIEQIGLDAEKFTEKSINLYGKPNKKSIKLSRKIIKKPLQKNTTTYIDSEEVKKRIEERLKFHEIDAKVILKEKNAPTKASVGKISGKITINKNYNWTEDDLVGTIAHEIDTHLVRLKNGENQKYGIFKIGTAGYLETEEGLATIMKYINQESKQMYYPALYNLAISFSLKNDFKTVFKKINNIIKNKEKSWEYTLRTKRGIGDTTVAGAFTKDQYFKWAVEIIKIIENPDIFGYLFNGKANIEELKNYTKYNNKYSIDRDDIENLKSVNL